MEEAQCVGLEYLRVVHNAPLLLRRRRDLHAEQHLSRFRTGQDMAYGTDPAYTRHEARHLLERTAFAELLESAKLGHMEFRGLDTATFIELNRNLGVTLNSRNRFNQDL